MPCVFRLQNVHLFDQGKARVPYQMQHGFCAPCLSSVSHCHFLPCLKVVIFVKSVQRCVALSQLPVQKEERNEELHNQIENLIYLHIFYNSHVAEAVIQIDLTRTFSQTTCLWVTVSVYPQE